MTHEADIEDPDAVIHHPQSFGRLKIDWTVPIWGVMGLFANAIAIVWWGAGINQRVATLETNWTSQQGTAATIARLDERSQAQSNLLAIQSAAIQRIEAHWDSQDTHTR